VVIVEDRVTATTGGNLGIEQNSTASTSNCTIVVGPDLLTANGGNPGSAQTSPAPANNGNGGSVVIH
jgi:hypothetical protein